MNNIERIQVAPNPGWQPEPDFGLEGHPGNVDHGAVLDLLAVIEDECRFHAAAAVLAEDRIECERYRVIAREDAALLASIRHGLAVIDRAHLSRRERSRQLTHYAHRLMVRLQRPRRHVLSSATNLQGGN